MSTATRSIARWTAVAVLAWFRLLGLPWGQSLEDEEAAKDTRDE